MFNRIKYIPESMYYIPSHLLFVHVSINTGCFRLYLSVAISACFHLKSPKDENKVQKTTSIHYLDEQWQSIFFEGIKTEYVMLATLY